MKKAAARELYSTNSETKKAAARELYSTNSETKKAAARELYSTNSETKKAAAHELYSTKTIKKFDISLHCCSNTLHAMHQQFILYVHTCYIHS